jgi:hypothetical protein
MNICVGKVLDCNDDGQCVRKDMCVEKRANWDFCCLAATCARKQKTTNASNATYTLWKKWCYAYAPRGYVGLSVVSQLEVLTAPTPSRRSVVAGGVGVDTGP